MPIVCFTNTCTCVCGFTIGVFWKACFFGFSNCYVNIHVHVCMSLHVPHLHVDVVYVHIDVGDTDKIWVVWVGTCLSCVPAVPLGHTCACTTSIQMDR